MKFRGYNMIQIHKGWSADKKYLLTNPHGEKKLLRMTDIAYLDQKKDEFTALKTMKEFQIPISKPIDFGVCDEKNQVWMLLSWIEGIDL